MNMIDEWFLSYEWRLDMRDIKECIELKLLIASNQNIFLLNYLFGYLLVD